jgi:hypothetical protein
MFERVLQQCSVPTIAGELQILLRLGARKPQHRDARFALAIDWRLDHLPAFGRGRLGGDDLIVDRLTLPSSSHGAL